MSFSLKGKKILITQRALVDFAGSEINTLEIASQLKKMGAEVIVYTWVYNNPIKEYFEKEKIYVTTNGYDEIINNLDYVWVHHQVLPDIVIDLLSKSKEKKPIFIFYHMSAIPDLYIEHPYIHHLEKELSSLSLFVSDEAREVANDYFPDQLPPKTAILPNCAPRPYHTDTKTHKTPSNILIVSNHPPEEILKLSAINNNPALKITYFGSEKGGKKKITPDILKQYDVVISIGKTVQYCLCMGIPVYVYDKFGGCGYLNPSNTKKASSYNFSGRGFSKKSPKSILEELIHNYSEALSYQHKSIESFRKSYDLTYRLEKIFKSLKAKKIKELDSGALFAIKACESMAQQCTFSQNSLLEISKYKKEIQQLQADYIKASSELAALKNSRTVRLLQSIKRRINRRLPLNKKKATISLAMCLYNESINLELCLRHIEQYVDRIYIYDDGSTDETVAIAKKHHKVKKIIKNTNKQYWAERNNRRTLLNAIYADTKNTVSWVLCLDADERLETNFIKRIKEITKQYESEDVALSLHFRELWDHPNQYRIDGIWNEKRKAILFKLSPHMTFNYENEHHIPWYYQELEGKEIVLDYNLYHLKMIKAEDRKKRADLYNSLDPERKMQKIGYDYLTNTSNIQLKQISQEETYSLDSVPDYYKHD